MIAAAHKRSAALRRRAGADRRSLGLSARQPASRSIVQRGDIVLLDCTCSVHGYQADITRTFVFGADPTPEQRKLWDQVHRGQQIAIAAAKPGVPAGSVDDAVRRAYESWGYGPGYGFPACRTAPATASAWKCTSRSIWCTARRRRWRRACASRTSPGIYIPGKFGVRLEDCWYMTAGGPKFFTQPPPSIDQPFG